MSRLKNLDRQMEEKKRLVKYIPEKRRFHAEKPQELIAVFISQNRVLTRTHLN